MIEKQEELIPEQQTGAESNIEEHVEFANVEEAKAFYDEVKQRLFSVSNWEQYAGVGAANFTLCDAHGNEVERAPVVGDHFKIDIPGPGTITGEGFDWVHIEAIEEIAGNDLESIIIRVRPTTNPNNELDDVAHFFSEEATSNFIVQRKGVEVTAAVMGRNEKPNVEAEKLV
ncbi:MAG TPA: hypothetical protein VEY06_09720, partial [Flavisolibacter sp.]|nr:hypothetical protein [Flavisolibacter sp.]